MALILLLQGSTPGKDILLVVEQIPADDGHQNDGKNGRSHLPLFMFPLTFIYSIDYQKCVDFKNNLKELTSWFVRL